MHIDYPIVADRVLGLGELPTVRLQRALAASAPDGAEWRALERVLVWAHWVWFAVPHAPLAYLLLRHAERFPRARRADLRRVRPRRRLLLADPDRAAVVRRPTSGRGVRATDGAGGERGAPADGRVRRAFLARRLGAALQCLGGNPLAAMPSLHFATR